MCEEFWPTPSIEEDVRQKQLRAAMLDLNLVQSVRDGFPTDDERVEHREHMASLI